MPQDKKNPQIDITDKSGKRVFWVLVFVVFVLVLYALGVFRFGTLRLPESATKEQAEQNRMTPRTAYDIALPEAKKWQADAALSSLTSSEETAVGRADHWKLIFTSPRVKQKGLLVVVADKVIVSTQEIPYAGFAADFPADIISEEEAINRVHQMKGYENEPILGIETVYGPAEKAWYWGVRTAKGVVTVEAKKK